MSCRNAHCPPLALAAPPPTAQTVHRPSHTHDQCGLRKRGNGHQDSNAKIVHGLIYLRFTYIMEYGLDLPRRESASAMVVAKARKLIGQRLAQLYPSAQLAPRGGAANGGEVCLGQLHSPPSSGLCSTIHDANILKITLRSCICPQKSVSCGHAEANLYLCVVKLIN